MKIAVWYHLGGGGAKRALFQHVRGLVARGHEVEVWTPSTSRIDYLSLADLCPEHVLPISEKKLGVDRSLIYRIGRAINPSLALQALDEHMKAVAAEIRDRGFDLLFANTEQYNAVPSLAEFLPDLPSVLYLQEPRRTSHEAMPVLPWVAPVQEPGNPHGMGLRDRISAAHLRRRKRVEARAEYENAHRYDRVLVNSNFSRESLLRIYGLDAKVCYLGVDTELFRPLPSPRKGGYLLGIGGISPLKRPDLAIRALGTLGTERPRLIWIGDRSHPDYLATLTNLADRLGVAFEVHHSAGDAQMIELMQSALAVIATARLEPFGYTPIEAGACGVPVIAVEEGGFRETVIDGLNGWLSAPEPVALGRAISECCTQPEEASKRGANGREQAVRRWNIEDAVSRLESNLEEVFTDRQGP
jgi:glycosyltransferase involved in cell wall biosynthesis